MAASLKAIPRTPDAPRSVQIALDAIRIRLEAGEASVTVVNKVAVAAQQTAVAAATPAQVLAVQTALDNLAILVKSLQNPDVVNYIADVAIDQWQVVAASSTTDVTAVDPNSAADSYGVIGIATTPANQGDVVPVQVSGVLQIPGATFTPGQMLFVGDDGQLGPTAPTYPCLVAVAILADTIVIRIIPGVTPTIIQRYFEDGVTLRYLEDGVTVRIEEE